MNGNRETKIHTIQPVKSVCSSLTCRDELAVFSVSRGSNFKVLFTWNVLLKSSPRGTRASRLNGVFGRSFPFSFFSFFKHTCDRVGVSIHIQGSERTVLSNPLKRGVRSNLPFSPGPHSLTEGGGEGGRSREGWRGAGETNGRKRGEAGLEEGECPARRPNSTADHCPVLTPNKWGAALSADTCRPDPK